MKKSLMIPLFCLAGTICLSGCGTSSGGALSSEPATLGPPQRAEFNEPLPESASYRRIVRRFNKTVLASKTAETYDDHGNIVRSASSDVVTGDETPMRSYSYIYNEDGSPAEVLDYGYVSTRTVYTYNENGDPLTVEVYDADSGVLKNTSVYEYNDHGDLIHGTLINGLNGQESVISSSSYEYDENGFKTQRQEFWNDGSVKYTETYTCDSSGNVLTAERINESGEIPKQLFSYEYDENGNTVCQTQQDLAADGTVTNESVLKSKYDQSGRIEKLENYLNGQINWYELYDYEELRS